MRLRALPPTRLARAALVAAWACATWFGAQVCAAAPCPVELRGAPSEPWARAGRAITEAVTTDPSDCARIEIETTLSLVDLASSAARLTMGIPSDVVGAKDQRASQIWSLAIHDHPAQVDGIAWASRLHGGTCCAVYDRALAKLRVSEVSPLTGFSQELANVIRRYGLALIP